MSKYFIEEVKCDWEGGCGPCCGAGVVVASIKYKDAEGTKYLTIHDVEGFKAFFKTEEEVMEKLLRFNEYDEDSDEYAEVDCMVNGGGLEDFDGVKLDTDSDDLIEYIDDLDDGTNMTAKLLRYGLSLIECSTEELKSLIAAGTGKAIEDLTYFYEFRIY